MLDSLVSAFIKYEHSNFFSATVYNLYKPINDIKFIKKKSAYNDAQYFFINFKNQILK